MYDKLQKNTSSQGNNLRGFDDKERKNQQPRPVLRRDGINEESIYNRLNVTPSSHKKNKNKSAKNNRKDKSKPVSTFSSHRGERADIKKPQTQGTSLKNLPKPPSATVQSTSQHQYVQAQRSKSSRDSHFKSEDRIENNQHELPNYEPPGLTQSKTRREKWTRIVKESTYTDTNNVSKYKDTNKIAQSLQQMGLKDESQHFKRLIRKRFQLEEEFIQINNQVGIQTLEGDHDECAFPIHSSVGGLKISKVPKSFIMVDEYDPKILLKNLNVLKDLEKRTIAVHRRCLQNQIK